MVTNQECDESIETNLRMATNHGRGAGLSSEALAKEGTPPITCDLAPDRKTKELSAKRVSRKKTLSEYKRLLRGKGQPVMEKADPVSFGR